MSLQLNHDLYYSFQLELIQSLSTNHCSLVLYKYILHFPLQQKENKIYSLVPIKMAIDKLLYVTLFDSTQENNILVEYPLHQKDRKM